MTAVSLEFGTVPPMEVFRALQAENWLHHRSEKDQALARKIKAELLRVFYPDEGDWKTRVWEQGKEAVEKVLAGLSN